MKAGEKTINLLACIALVLSTGFGVKALELWNERQLAVEQTQKLQGQLTQQIRFADEHSDYKTYKIKLLDKQKKLEQYVEHNLSLNNRLQRLQKQARAQSIHLNSMQMEGSLWLCRMACRCRNCKQVLSVIFIPCFAGCGRQNAMAVRLRNCACKA